MRRIWCKVLELFNSPWAWQARAVALTGKAGKHAEHLFISFLFFQQLFSNELYSPTIHISPLIVWHPHFPNQYLESIEHIKEVLLFLLVLFLEENSSGDDVTVSANQSDTN